MPVDMKKAKKLCAGITGLCGAHCTILTLTPQPTIHTEGDWLCSQLNCCDHCNTLHYGCSEAYRWQGKYTFYCPKGLIFIVAAIGDEHGNPWGGLALGPVVMGDMEDMISLNQDEEFYRSISDLPQWDTVKVRHAEEILVAVAESLSANEQSKYGSFVYEQDKMVSELYKIQSSLKQDSADDDYLIRSERQLQTMIVNNDKEGAQKLLNEILGYIFYKDISDISTIKARLIETLVLISRSAIEAGAGIQEILNLNQGNIKQILGINSIEDLSAWISVVMQRFIQYSFDFSTVKHSDTLYKIIQYVKSNYDKKITLDDVANHVYLSRSYVSSMFKSEMGEGLSAYINRIRIEKSKVLLRNQEVSLVEVGGLCGFEDQSYFTKVFKNLVGMSPKKYRESRGANKK